MIAPGEDFGGALDSSNEFLVGMKGDKVVIIRPKMVLTRGEAVNLAVWLVALADPGRRQFDRVIREVCK